VQTLVNCRAQLEGDTLRDIQPMQLVVQDLIQTSVELPLVKLGHFVFEKYGKIISCELR